MDALMDVSNRSLLHVCQSMTSSPVSVLTYFAVVICLCLCPTSFSRGNEALSLERGTLNAVFSKYCNDCHADGAEEGSFSLDKLGNDLASEANMAQWVRLFDRVAANEMPPEDYDQPGTAERKRFLDQLAGTLTKAHQQQKGTVFRRLNRSEYENTMNDLFGTELELGIRLPEDGRSHEFDNVGSALSISLVQLQRYLEATDRVLNESIAKYPEKPEPKTIVGAYKGSREGDRFIGQVWKQLDDDSVVLFRSGGYPTGMVRDTNVRQAGTYHVKVKAYAYQTDKPLTFRVGGTSFQRAGDRPTYGYFSAPPNEMTTFEFTTRIKQNYMIEITPYGINAPDSILKKTGVDNYEGPGLAVHSVELVGPLYDEYPSRGHRMLFDGIKRTEIEPRNPRDKQRSWYVPRFQIEANRPEVQAAKVLQRVATQAFRRPVNKQEIADYEKLFLEHYQVSNDFEESLKSAVSAILISPEFLYLPEGQGTLNNYEMASRLSYFLSRTTPDGDLMQAADQGALGDEVELINQARRLMADPRFARFIVDFTDAWLNLREIQFTTPDNQLFPEYDPYLQYSIIAETRAFFWEMVVSNEPVRKFVKPDFAMLNERLTTHYELPPVEGSEIRRVPMNANQIRGGLLSQASVLKVSANGTNSSPVVRGVYVMERLLGQTPPPPPPGVPGVEPDIRGASTLREILTKHRDVDSCRTCHQLIDPPGFALECFNPIGGFRENYRSLGQGERVRLSINGRNVRYRIGPEVDASGEFLDGSRFKGYRDFLTIMAANDEVLAKTFVTKLLTFATGRDMGFSDRPEIDRLVQQAKGSNYGVRDLIELVVTSSIFRNK